MKRHPNLLDNINRLLISNNSELPENLFDDLALSNGSKTDCENQIKIMNADHKFHSHFNNRILDFFDLLLENVNSTSIKAEESDIKVYPNPTQNHIIITNIKESTSVYIISVTGKILKREIGKSIINIEYLTNGVYLIKVNDSGNVLVKTIVKGYK